MNGITSFKRVSNSKEWGQILSELLDELEIGKYESILKRYGEGGEIVTLNKVTAVFGFSGKDHIVKISFPSLLRDPLLQDLLRDLPLGLLRDLLQGFLQDLLRDHPLGLLRDLLRGFLRDLLQGFLRDLLLWDLGLLQDLPLGLPLGLLQDLPLGLLRDLLQGLL
ncbi:uncharacterized protein LOC115694876 isoform X2 [Cannabis sativa]|nr:uncharacterized protein LOC115694876 isoform X2 [Cannabis sativa]